MYKNHICLEIQLTVTWTADEDGLTSSELMVATIKNKMP